MPSQDKAFIVAVDGPAASGKSSVCSACADELAWIHVNTGMFYRATALLTHRKKLQIDQDLDAILVQANYLATHFKWNYKKGLLLLDGEVLNPKLSAIKIGDLASKLASIPELRHCLLSAQRTLGLKAPEGAILDGRDIASVVFPDAHLKIFLTASLKARAQRRWLQIKRLSLQEKQTSLAEIEKAIAARDKFDSERKTAPLKQDPDALLFDTSLLSFRESIAELKKIILSHQNKRSN